MSNLEDLFDAPDIPGMIPKVKECHLIGHITQLDYDTATILSHDYNVNTALFIPKGTFLLIKLETHSTTTQPGKVFASILCRVMSLTYIDSQNKENKQISVQKLVGVEKAMDEQKHTNDVITQHHLSFYQLNCKILGSFYENDQNELLFGSDAYSFAVANIYGVYKPVGKKLEKIVNYIKQDRLKATNELLEKLTGKVNHSIDSFEIGCVRYASTLIESVDKNIQLSAKSIVKILPADFIKQKTGIFGMTRTGKSNTVKVIARSIMELSQSLDIPMGQVIYDINGEYANDNEQNRKLDNSYIYTVDNGTLEENNKFLPALNNFYQTADYGLKIIQQGLKDKNEISNYVNNFQSIKNIESNVLSHILWILLLYKSGYDLPEKQIKGHNFYFGEKENENVFIWKITDSEQLQNIQNNNFISPYLSKNLLTLPVSKLNILINQLKYKVETLINNQLFDDDQKSLISFITQADINGDKIRKGISGWQMVVPYKDCHCVYGVSSDYREEIYNKISEGQTVIIDFSIGSPFTRKYIADEIMSYIFEKQISVFRKDIPCPIINVFIEEAHNVIGKNAAIDSLWPRIAKEGAKYNIGLLYATQEPSAIHPSILANTANFIVAHLNNEDEIRTIAQYEDLGDFSEITKKAEDVGFVRMRLLSKPYTIPVQIKKYT